MELITTHENADFDTLGAMTGAKLLYPNAMVSFPGSLEKGLKDAIKALELPFRFEEPQAIDLSKVTLLVLVDISHSSRIGRFRELLGKRGTETHVYDHHPKKDSDIKATKAVFGATGSTSAIIALILKKKGLRPGKNEATAMMAGIYEDTGFLSFPSTSADDFLAASYLLECGAELASVTRLLKKEMTTEEVSMLNELLKNERRYAIGSMNISINSASAGRFGGDLSALAHKIMDIRRLDGLVLIAETGGRTHFVLRSATSGFNAGTAAKTLGGGGHAQAASAVIKGITAIQAADMAITAVRGAVSGVLTARDIMSSPPITVSCDSTIKEASSIMLKYNVNALPVIKNSKAVGVITRQIADKASHHGLKNEKVSEFMSTGFMDITTGTTIDAIRENILDYGQRIMIVTDKGALAGVITRTDLIKLLKDEMGQAGTAEVRKRRNVSHLMKEALPPRFTEMLTDIGSLSEEAGLRAYAVGGFVRDIVLRRQNLDIDIVVEGDGISLASTFAKKYGLHVSAHPRFSTAVVTFPDGFKLDVATARIEHYEKPGALPTVETSSLKLDLFRRDFTINTLAIALNKERCGDVIDFFGGQNDLKDGVIRALHNLSFVEDPIRAIRAVRFAERFGFKINDHTMGLIRNSIRLGMLKKASGARILDELKNCFAEDRSTEIMRSLGAIGLLKLIHPSMEWNARIERVFDAAKGSLSWYRLLYKNEPVEEWLTLFMALTSGLKQDALNSLCQRLSLPGKKRLSAIGLRSASEKTITAKLRAGNKASLSDAYMILQPLPLELTLYVLSKTDDAAVKKALSHYIASQRGEKTMLNGEDLKKLGFKEGKHMGRVLNALLKARLDKTIATREEEAAFVKKLSKIRARS